MSVIAGAPVPFRTIGVAPLAPALGAEITGVNLQRPIIGQQAADLREALTRHLVLFFREQDVTEEQRWPEIIAATVERYGRLDIMVANAGVGIGGMIIEMTLEAWRRQTAINLDGVFLSVKHSIPALMKSGGGSIIITSSVAGLRGAPGLAGYCATKGGVRLFAKAAAMECAAMNANIRVNTIHPGIIDTPIWGKIPGERAGANAAIDPHEMAKFSVPVRRAGRAQDIANGVLYLASDLSAYVTGTELVIDGGMTAGTPIARPAG